MENRKSPAGGNDDEDRRPEKKVKLDLDYAQSKALWDSTIKKNVEVMRNLEQATSKPAGTSTEVETQAHQRTLEQAQIWTPVLELNWSRVQRSIEAVVGVQPPPPADVQPPALAQVRPPARAEDQPEDQLPAAAEDQSEDHLPNIEGFSATEDVIDAFDCDDVEH